MNARTWMVGLLVFVAMIAVAACGGPAGESGGNKQNLSLNFEVGSNEAGPQQAGAATPMAVNTSDCGGNVCGYLLVVPRGGDSTEQRFQFSVDLDLSKSHKFSYELPLDPGTYDIYFLLNTPGRQFGGVVSGQVIVTGGLNPIIVLVNPVLSPTRIDLDGFRNLGAFVIDYTDKVAQLQGFSRPRFGISIDGSPELYFNIFVDPAHPTMTLFTTAGEHSIVVRFFDGAVATDSTPPGDTTNVPPTTDTTGQPPEVRPEALVSNVNYTVQTGAGTSTFEFTVPPDVASEAGAGPNDDVNASLRTVISLVGPEIELFEQDISLSASRDANQVLTGYVGSLTVPMLFQQSVTWQLRFFNRTTGALIAYCAQAASGPGTFGCDLHLLVSRLATIDPPATLNVTVSDPNGAVAGAVVTLNGQPVGLTGNGVDEGAGMLQRFVTTPGTYPFQVTDSAIDTNAPGTPVLTRQYPAAGSPVVSVTLQGGQTLNQLVSLPLFPFTSPTPPPPPPPTPEAPTVVSTTTTPGTDGVSVDSLIKVRFSIAMDPASVLSVFSLSEFGAPQASDMQWSTDGTEVTYTPPTQLQHDHGYLLTIGQGALAQNGGVLANTYTFGFHTETLPTVEDSFTLMPGRQARPRRYDDSWVKVTTPITVRVPTMDDISVAVENGQVLGDPNRFLMVLHLGKVRCMYLGGKWDQEVGGFVEQMFKDNFTSPVCNRKDVHGGSLVTVNPGDSIPPGHEEEGDDDDEHGNAGTQIRARIISANPYYFMTRLNVVVKVTSFTPPLPVPMNQSSLEQKHDR